MKFKDASLVAAFLIVISLLAACGQGEAPATMAPTQPAPTDVPATPVPAPPTATAAPPPPAAAEWPAPRKYGAMAYDPASERILLFGGLERYASYAELYEVWAFDPATGSWQEQGELVLHAQGDLDQASMPLHRTLALKSLTHGGRLCPGSRT